MCHRSGEEVKGSRKDNNMKRNENKNLAARTVQ